MVPLEVVESIDRASEAERHAFASFPFTARRFAYRSISSDHRLATAHR
jgi:hypothetical protein